MDDHLKTCSKCGVTKPVSEYSASSKKKWLRSACKACRYKKKPRKARPAAAIARPACQALVISSSKWEAMTALEREYAIMLAQDIVSVGVLTEAESRAARLDAWKEIDKR